MYWCNPQLYTRLKGSGPTFMVAAALLLCIPSCKPDINGTGKQQAAYFNLKGFFYTDSARLSHLNPSVNKTVILNDAAETKKVHIGNWGNELSLFINSDINKPAWRGSYSTTKSNGIIIYQTRLPDLKTRKVMIKTDGDTVKWIFIHNYTKNLLYENYEDLTYFPDSLYLIKKWQKVKLLGIKKYIVRGVIEK